MDKLDKLIIFLKSSESNDLFALLKDGNIDKVSTSLKPTDIEKFLDSKEMEKEIIKLLFNKDRVGKDGYKKILNLAMIVKRHTNPNVIKPVQIELGINFGKA